MQIEFDPAKDRQNLLKHGMSLARVAEMTDIIVVSDDRYDEKRYRLYGLLDDVAHCAAVTMRGGAVRVISLRRAHRKEYRRHV